MLAKRNKDGCGSADALPRLAAGTPDLYLPILGRFGRVAVAYTRWRDNYACSKLLHFLNPYMNNGPAESENNWIKLRA
jgi:hypothetical protein